MDTFWRLFRQNLVVQGALALMFGATVCVLALKGQEAPALLVAVLGTIIGFYFGSKNRLST